MIILFTSNNIASKNIAKKLIEKHGFIATSSWWEKDGIKLIDTKLATVLEVPPGLETDCIVMLSTHKSKTPGKMLTAHIPGNWNEAGLGGMPKTLNIAAASRLKKIAIELKKQADKINWPFCLEADHHGPTIETPILFVEIGNDEEQWKDEMAAEAVANAVAASLGKIDESETVIGFGGGHYQKKFTDFILTTNYAIGHIGPKYIIDTLDEEVFRQAVEKNVEEVKKVIVLKEETNLKQKNRIREMCERFGIEYGEM